MIDGVQIVSQRPETRPDPHGPGVAEGMRVTFFDRTTGVTDSVWVPESTYHPETVEALILARLQRSRGIHGLSDTTE